MFPSMSFNITTAKNGDCNELCRLDLLFLSIFLFPAGHYTNVANHISAKYPLNAIGRQNNFVTDTRMPSTSATSGHVPEIRKL